MIKLKHENNNNIYVAGVNIMFEREIVASSGLAK